ncbi:MAG: Ig-like domain-containing protein [Chitinispirillaceae bacterium]|nr:Ig-like domain-containing protein [Chitinispirillaceae bacterium]
MNARKCPLVTADFELIERFLRAMPLHELVYYTEQLFSQLTSSEKVAYDINRYCSSYSDHEGRIRFVRTLIDRSVVSMVHVPLSYRRDPRLINLLRPKAYDYFIPVAQEMSSEAAALTDALETAPESSMTVSNPRWEHSDEKRKEKSPAIVVAGDAIALMVDITGYPEGAPVTFDIFDACSDPSMRIDTVKGKNEGGTARITWTVADPNERRKELKLEFEGSARSKSSGKAPIDIATNVYRVELIDEEGNKLEGVKVVFTVAGESAEVLTDKEGIAEHPAKDPLVKAEVQVEWEEGSGG